MSEPRVVFLGLDGATLDLVRPWAAGGVLPTFARLLAEGAAGPLRSTHPPITPIAWPTIYTGTNPGRHGIFGFERRLPDEYRWVKSSAADLRRPPVWELTPALRSAVLFAPYTYPAAPITGVLVAGRGAPSTVTPATSSPTDLAPRLAARYGDVELFGPRRPAGATLGEITSGLIRSIEAQGRAIEDVVVQERPDLVFAIWDQTDTAAHLLWHHSETPAPDADSPIATVYRAVDRAMERVLDAAGGNPLVVVCSDHGAYPIRHRVRVPLWLEREGLLEIGGRRGGKLLSRAASVWMRIPETIRPRPPRRARRAHEEAYRQNAFVTWTGTRVYPAPVAAEALYLNRRGREPAGVVEPDEVSEVVERTVAALRGLHAPSGEPLVEDALVGADIYEGSFTADAPDVVAHVARGVFFSPTPAGPLHDTPARPGPDDPPRSLGYHDLDGLLILAGDQVRAGKDVTAGVADIAPTILRYLGLPVPRDMDGNAVVGAFEELPAASFTAPRSYLPTSEGLTAAEEGDLERQLRDLGYIE